MGGVWGWGGNQKAVAGFLGKTGPDLLKKMLTYLGSL